MPDATQLSPNLLNNKVWIFQANPTLYKIENSLGKETQEYWNLNQHYKEVKVGDTVLIWISGSESGIYAMGSVVTGPEMMPDSPVGMDYWLAKEKGKRVTMRVLVRYDKKFLENPLLKVFLQLDPELWNLRIIKFPRGTNFPVSEPEWNALKFWLDDNEN